MFGSVSHVSEYKPNQKVIVVFYHENPDAAPKLLAVVTSEKKLNKLKEAVSEYGGDINRISTSVECVNSLGLGTLFSFRRSLYERISDMTRVTPSAIDWPERK